MKLFTVNNLSNLLGVTRLGVAILLTFLRSASGDSSLPERSKWNCCPGTTFLFSQSLFHSSWIFLLLPDSFWLTMARDSSNMEQYICIMSKLIWIQVPFHRISNNVNKYTVHDIGNYFLNNNQDYQKGILFAIWVTEDLSPFTRSSKIDPTNQPTYPGQFSSSQQNFCPLYFPLCNTNSPAVRNINYTKCCLIIICCVKADRIKFSFFMAQVFISLREW